MIKKAFKHIRDQYVINQVRRADIPEFAPSPICRYQIRFSGRVQKVGFRLEVFELANRLGLTGTCENIPNGDVYAELQGEENRIHFLISFMESLKRIKITHKQMEKAPLCQEETSFLRK